MQELANIEAAKQNLVGIARSKGFSQASGKIKGARVVLDLGVEPIDPGSVSKSIFTPTFSDELERLRLALEESRPLTPSALVDAIRVSTLALSNPTPGASLAKGDLELLKLWMLNKIDSLPPFLPASDINFNQAVVQIEAVCPAYKAPTIDHVSLSKSMSDLRDYIDNVKKCLGRANCSERISRDDLQQVEEAGFMEMPTSTYPVYFFTVGDGQRERVVYVGIKADETQRFKAGHKAAWGLMNPEYEGMSKKLYIGKIVVQNGTDQEVEEGMANSLPLEWVETSQEAAEVLKTIESQLIYYFQPELNTIHLKSLYKEGEAETMHFDFVHIIQKGLDSQPFEHQMIPYKGKK